MKKKYLILFCCVVLTQAQAKILKEAVVAPIEVKTAQEKIQPIETNPKLKIQSKVFKIKLDELISIVVKQNAKMRYEKLHTQIIKQDIEYEEGSFESEIFANVGNSYQYKQNSIQEAIARDQQSTYEEDVGNVDIGIRGVNVYGTQWSATAKTFSTSSSLIDNSNSGIDKEYVSGLYLEIKQPLLKGFGSDVGKTNINLAILEDDLTEEEYKKKAMNLVEEVVLTYWRLYGSFEIYKTWQETITLLKQQKIDIQKKVRAGNMARVNLLQMDSAIFSSRVEMLSSLDMLEKEKNNILALLNTSVLENSAMLEATDKPLIEDIKIPHLQDAIELSLANFPEFNIILNKIEQENLRIGYATNQTLPSLDFVGKVNNDNLDENWNAALSKTASNDYVSWYAGINFSIPINGNMKASSELKKQKLKLQQINVEKDSLKINLINELDLKIKNLTRNKLRMAELEKALEIKNKISENYAIQLKYGKTNAKELIDVYVDAILAKRKYLKGIIEIKISEAILYKAMGTLLEKHNVNLKDTGTFSKNEKL